jgi:hypothetical protein
VQQFGCPSGAQFGRFLLRIIEFPQRLGKYPVLKWFNAREAAKAGTALADQFPRPPVPVSAALGKEAQLRRAHGDS